MSIVVEMNLIFLFLQKVLQKKIEGFNLFLYTMLNKDYKNGVSG